jgi:hypothetical protein
MPHGPMAAYWLKLGINKQARNGKKNEQIGSENPLAYSAGKCLNIWEKFGKMFS